MSAADNQSKSRSEQKIKQELNSLKKKERVLSVAIGEGIKYTVLNTTLAGAGSYLASKYSPIFNKSMSISAKVSLPVMAGLFSFAFVIERTMNNIQRFPEKWGFYESVTEEEQAKERAAMIASQTKFHVPIHHYVSNRIYGMFIILTLCTY